MIPFQSEFWLKLHYDNIFVLTAEVLLAGGWFFIFWSLWPQIKDAWLNWRQNLFGAINPHILMELRIPEDSGQDIESIEHFFRHIHAIHRNETWWERWWKGMYVLKFSVEIVSFEGHIKYYIRSTYKHKHTIQEAIYAQYPKAEVKELRDEEDFIHTFPDKMPDTEFEMLGSEYVLYKPHYYPIKTYRGQRSEEGKYIDPLKHLLEIMSSAKEGEYMWYQLVMVPVREGWGFQYEHHARTLQGQEVHGKKHSSSLIGLFATEIWSFVSLILRLIVKTVAEIFRQIFGGTGRIVGDQVAKNTITEVPRQLRGMGKEAASQILCLHEAFLSQFRKKQSGKDKGGADPFMINNYIKSDPSINVEVNAPATKFPSDYLFLSEGRKKLIDSVERKLSQQIFKSSVRILYFAKKPVFAKFRFWVEMHAFFRHFSDPESNVLIRGKYSMTTADYFFSRLRKKMRQNSLIVNAKARDWFAGDEWVHLSAEELASLWHFPIAEGLLANVEEAHESVIAPRASLRGRAGYKKERLAGLDAGKVPDELPVTEFEPYNYP